jgi:Fe-S-cluster-containing hydrogenase component 2
LGTILLDAEVSESSQPINYNPCLECKLCVAACPVGAISPEGDFNFSACYTHNYREFMGGFTDWVEQVADSKNARDYRRRVSDAESASMWQSLSYGANYKSAYCLAVCPAGEDVIGPFLADRKTHLKEIVRPLQEKEETIYVTKNSDAEDHVAKRFPHKKIKHVGNSLRPNTIEVFLKLPDPYVGDHAWMGVLSWQGRAGDAGKTQGYSRDESVCSLNVSPERFLQFVLYPHVQDASPTSWSHAIPTGRWFHVAVVNDGERSVVWV